MEKLALSLFGAFCGFALSQLFNLVNYLRRPKFKVVHYGDGVISCYTGDPPETPWEIQFGFFLENCGRNPAKNTRIFVASIHSSEQFDGDFEENAWSFSELERPIDIIPSGEAVSVTLGRVLSDSCFLQVPFQSDRDRVTNEYLEADTRFKVKFRAKFFVCCDEKNSSCSFVLDFVPEDDGWSSQMLDDYESKDFRRKVLMTSDTPHQ